MPVLMAMVLFRTLCNNISRSGLQNRPIYITSLIDFRERIQINGIPISKRAVISLIEKYKNFIENIQPSFFENTVALCFDYLPRIM
jgi:uncharacterized membrane protein